MASSFSKDQLRKEINAILKNADLEKTSAKEVRLQLQNKLKVDFSSRKKELDKLIMEAVNSMQDSESDEDPSEESEPEVKPAKRTSTTAKKRKVEESDESDYKPKKSTGGGRKKRRGSSGDDDSDEDWKESKKKGGGGGKKGKATGFTRPYKLSPELSELMGEVELPRHEVVKKVWKIIKEKNLYDPKNKQYAICDEQLEKVIGVKRFRTFGMMKYLMPHFIK
ncbi:unnamed protein product [Chironomus riparius]|uniref:DM2 domain-containing protein n=1 Tax=Chironomus riparius TaxID=315576 RepID=A0A9N9S2W1_9DIPT|nr:unnamed protein product [Chironomus riparius]